MKARGYSSQTIHDITANIRPELVEHHSNNISKNKYFAPSLYELVHTTIETELHNETDAEELRRLYTNKKRTLVQKQKRQYENCKKMVETRAWEIDDIDRYCFKSDVLNHNMFSPDQWNSIYAGKTFEEVQIDRLHEVENWYKNPDALMIQYPGQERRTPKRQFESFQSDLTLDVLSIMKRLYNWDMENLTFPIMNDLTEKPVFTAKRETVSRNPDGNKNSVVIFTSEDGRRRTVITFEDAAFGDSDKTALFDYKDSSILSYLLRAAIKYDSTLPILIEKSKIIKAAMNGSTRKPTKKDYDDIDARLRKLSQAYIESYVDDQWVGTFHMVDAIEKQDIDSRKYIAFYPSEYMTEQIENNGISQLPTDLKDRLHSDAAKLFYAPLMMQRVKAFKRMRSNGEKNDYFEVAFQYGHFLRFVNFGKGNQQDNHKAILSVLDEYKEEGIFLHDYRYVAKTKTYYLIFKPLTDIEIQDLSYYFGDEYAIENINLQQISVFSYIEES